MQSRQSLTDVEVALVVESRNLSIMFTDIKGFTARTSKSSREDLVNLLRRHEEIVLPLAQARGGSLIKTIGDAFLLTFQTPTDAVLAAIDAQVALSHYNATVNDDARIEVRIAINAGEVTVIEGDVFGDAVNVAARIESVAEANEIFFSETIALTMNKTEVSRALQERGMAMSELGYQTFKGVADPIRVHKIQTVNHTPMMPMVDLAPSGDIALELGAATPSAAKGNLPHASAGSTPSGSFQMESALAALEHQRPTPKAATSTRQTGRMSVVHRAKAARGRQALKVAAVALAVILSLASPVLLVAAVLFESLWCAGLGLLWLLAVQPWRLGPEHSRVTFTRIAAALAVVAMLTALGDMPVQELQLRFDNLSYRLHRQGASSLTTRDKGAVFLAQALVALSHVLNHRLELAVMQTHILRPGKPARTWRSDFALDAPTVARVFGKLAKKLKVEWHRGTESFTMPAQELRLNPSHDPPALAQALAEVRLSAKARRTGNGWTIYATLQTTAQCPPPGEWPVWQMGRNRITLEQTLCTLLVTERWLYPYTATFVWTVPSDDPRLATSDADEVK